MPERLPSLLIVLRTANGGFFSRAGRSASRLRWLALCSIIGLMAVVAPAQEALRASLAGQAAAESQRLAQKNGHYNVEWGPISLRAQTSMATTATDNVKNSTDRQWDLIFSPQVSMFGVWRVTDKNSLSLTVGFGYSKYVNTTEYDSFFLTPGSDLSFSMFVQDFVINLHNRFAYTQDVSNDPTVSGVGSLNRFDNTTGVTVTWDLNKVILRAGYDHAIYQAVDSGYSYQNYSAELFNLSAGVTVNPFSVTGLEVGGGMTSYDEQTLNNYSHVSIGPFYSLRVSDYTSLRASVGYAMYFYDATGTNSSSSTVDGFYADLTYQQRVNAMLSHSLSAGRQLQSGLFSQSTEIIYVRYGAQWNVILKTSLGTSISYEHTSNGGGPNDAGQNNNGDRYGFGLSLSRPLTQHLSGSLAYQFYWRQSEDAANDYYQNQLVLGLTYAF